MVFEDVVGESHITTTLRNALASNRLSHAYIFSGPRGVGKTTTARILAKAINCEHPIDFNPDNTCDLCREITEGRSVNVFEIDGASNRGVDEIRNLRDAVRYGPAKGKYKVYIIDEVHMLTKEAFNALLKTLEEPPSYVVFIFATTEIHKVPQTILSRCQRFDFRRIAVDEIITRLRFIAGEERITIDDEALHHIARRADGSLRDAQSVFDQVVSYCGNENITGKEVAEIFNMVDEDLYFRLTGLITTRDVRNGLQLVDDVITRGYDIREFLNGLIEHFRNLLVVRATESTRLVEASEASKKKFQDSARSFTESDLLRFIRIATEAESAIRWSQAAGSARYKLEICVVQMIKLDRSVQINQLLEQIEELKKKLNGRSAETSAPSAKPEVRNPEPLRQAPIQGSVRASQPHLRPDQVVPSPVSTSEAPNGIYRRQSTPTVTQVAAVQYDSSPAVAQIQEPVRAISLDEAFSKWGSFIEQARKQRIAVGTMLSETRVVNVQGNNIQIGCPDDFHLEGLKRHRTFLMDLAQQVYGAKVRLETLITTEVPPVPTSASPTNRTTTEEMKQPDTELRQHPVVRAIVNEFAAKELE